MQLFADEQMIYICYLKVIMDHVDIDHNDRLKEELEIYDFRIELNSIVVDKQIDNYEQE